FDDFDYVALGHLHGKQMIKRDEVRYCGTPLKYSFSEKDHAKSVTVVELSSKGDVRISERLLTPLHDLREIRGTYEEVTDRKNYEGTAVDDYLKIILTDENDIPEAIGKLRVIYKNLMKLEYDNARTRNREMMTDAEDVENKSPLELFAEFYEKQNSTPMTDEQRELVLECIESVWGDGS
ncbi:MAG: exonuclease SbcCD subunit D C-terminal domain-containing protein, partial [Lachnospiraceae bacterium]|nr:exonuclease SbcCD subunit D C-terminal domain-containing protein [Lachnospiraceae bacterium]